MTHCRRRTNSLSSALLLLSLLASAGLSLGCRGTGRTGDDGTGGRADLGGERTGELASNNPRDPLFGKHRIPPQNLPTGKDGTFYGSRDGLHADPLFRDPFKNHSTGSPKTASTPTPETVGMKEPFRPGADVTAAALASGRSDNELVIDDRTPRPAVPTRGVPLKSVENNIRPIPGTVGRGAAGGAAGLTVEMLTEELRKIGGRPYAPVRLNNGEYEFKCAVPLNDRGAMRSYSGTGTTPLAAVRNVYEQIRLDDGK